MYELTTEGMFQQVLGIERALGRKLKDSDDLFFVRSDVVCLDLETVFVLAEEIVKVPFFELSKDIQEDIVSHYEHP